MNKMLTNCPNCGAPLTKDGRCDYCKTKVRIANLMEINCDPKHYEPIEILLKFKRPDGTIYLVPFSGMLSSMDINYDNNVIYVNDNPKIVGNNPEITLTIEGHLCELPKAESKENKNE
jgi:hypothetical protein